MVQPSQDRRGARGTAAARRPKLVSAPGGHPRQAVLRLTGSRTAPPRRILPWSATACAAADMPRTAPPRRIWRASTVAVTAWPERACGSDFMGNSFQLDRSSARACPIQASHGAQTQGGRIDWLDPPGGNALGFAEGGPDG